LIAPPEMTPGGPAFEKKLSQRREALRKHVDAQYREITELLRNQTTDYLLAVLEPPGPLETSVFFLSLSPNDLRPQVTARWRRYVRQHFRADDPVFGPWHDLMDLPGEGFSEQAAKVLKHWQTLPTGTGASQVNPLVRQALLQAKLAGPPDVARAYG